MSHAVRAWGPALLWAGIIFGLSSRPTLPVAMASGGDKVAHFAAYCLLGFLLSRAARASSLAWAWPVLLGAFYGATDELHQRLVPGRVPDAGDWLADLAGTIAGVALYYYHRRRTGAPSSESLAHE